MYQEQENSINSSISYIESLLIGRANVNVADHRGLTPLHYSAHGNRLEEMKLLLQKGAEINAKSCDGVTPLHLAVQEGYKDVVELLLVKGADINAADSFGVTSLHLSVRGGHTEITRLLLGEMSRPNTSCSNINIEGLQTQAISQYFC